jgi:hypothetical protein
MESADAVTGYPAHEVVVRFQHGIRADILARVRKPRLGEHHRPKAMTFVELDFGCAYFTVISATLEYGP